MIIMIRRELYLDQIKDHIDDPMIKVIKGIRRSGKTELLKMIIETLKENGIEDSQIIYINYESFDTIELRDFKKLYHHIKEIYDNTNRKLYIFLDEIQEVKSWEQAIRGIRVDIPSDIYLTGSNADLLSGELATLLAGRYVEIDVYPLSYNEFKLFYKDIIKETEPMNVFSQYLKRGGFPDLINIKQKDSVIDNYLKSIYNTVVLRDVIERNEIRNPEQLKRILVYIMDNIGQLTSGGKIIKYLKGVNNENLSTTALYKYIDALENALIIYSAKPYDIKRKRLMKRSEKFYLADLGLRHTVLGYKENDIAQMLENIVYLELLRRGYEVYVGRIDQYEVDFVAKKKNKIKYYQVSYSILDEGVAEREYRSLEMIEDNYEKYVLTMDTLALEGRNGIQWQNIVDFLEND
jgi:hypothetical protein